MRKLTRNCKTDATAYMARIVYNHVARSALEYVPVFDRRLRRIARRNLVRANAADSEMLHDFAQVDRKDGCTALLQKV